MQKHRAPVIGKLVPRLKDSAALLYKMYIGLSAIMVVLLLIQGLPIFDALCITFGTAGTGGFSVYNEGLALYNSASVEWTVTIFMLIFGINFNMFYFLLLKHFKAVFKNEELRMYLGIVVVSVLVITLNIAHMYDSNI